MSNSRHHEHQEEHEQEEKHDHDQHGIEHAHENDQHDQHDEHMHDHDHHDDHGHDHSHAAHDHHDHHDHQGHHHHDHSDVFHTHAPVEKMKLAFFLTLLILVAEVVGGYLSHSLALLSDAGHVLTDIAAIGLSWYALSQSQKPPNEKMTFGYHRSGILAALFNAVTLIVIAIVILVEAYQRFQHPQPVGSTWMFISASVGLVINLFLGLGLSKEENINVRSAVLHMLGDAAASAGVIIGGVVILFTGWYQIDPILSVLIALLIGFGAWRIVKQTVGILMEATPHGVDVEKVVSAIRTVSGVLDVHDLHIWSLTSGKNALSCHIVVDSGLTVGNSQSILREIEHRLVHLNIGHATIQTEDAAHPHKDTLLCGDDLLHDPHGHHHHDHHGHSH